MRELADDLLVLVVNVHPLHPLSRSAGKHHQKEPYDGSIDDMGHPCGFPNGAHGETVMRTDAEEIVFGHLQFAHLPFLLFQNSPLLQEGVAVRATVVKGFCPDRPLPAGGAFFLALHTEGQT